MRILLGISALVLIAILWAMFSILRHIRVARRRNQMLRNRQSFSDIPLAATPVQHPAVPSLTALPSLPPRFAAPTLPPTDTVKLHPTPYAPVSLVPTQTPAVAARDQSAPLNTACRPVQADPAPQSLRILEFVPEPPVAPPAPPPAFRRPVRSVPPMRPALAANASGRPAWDYFNKDMGDLSDPTPSRIRDRVRPR